MPAHLEYAHIGSTTRSDNRPVTAIDFRGNRLVYFLAKWVAGRMRAPKPVRNFIESAEAMFAHSASLLGTFTHAASNYSLYAYSPAQCTAKTATAVASGL